MESHTAGVLGSSLLVASGLIIAMVGFVRGDDNSIVIGSSVVLMASGAMAALSSTSDAG